MSRTLYLECYAGISGDMTVGALLDLGADEDKLRKTLASLALTGYAIEVKRVKKAGLDVCDFAVRLDAEHENHDHDMAYLHGAPQGCVQGMPAHVHMHGDEMIHEHMRKDEIVHGREHMHEHEAEYNYAHTHEAGIGHGHAHTHRGLSEIMEILDGSGMTACAKATARRIFQILAEAEAKAHGAALSEVHFHEVGAVDSIVDVAAVAICLDDLGIEDVIVPVLYEGCGTIRCQHGVIPIPAPATLNVVSAYHLPLHQTGIFGEFVTPTGAAIVAAVCTERELPGRYTVEKIGLGAGKRTYERPSILRAMLITPEEEPVVPPEGNPVTPEEEPVVPLKENPAAPEKVLQQPNHTDGFGDCIVKLECNLDDCTGEALGYAMGRLFAAGARDVFYTPVFMKKNRPGYLLTVLCTPETSGVMEEILFSETSTIGVRRVRMERSILPREVGTVQTREGTVKVKTVRFGGGERKIPEYESVAALARERKLPFRDLYMRIEAELN